MKEPKELNNVMCFSVDLCCDDGKLFDSYEVKQYCFGFQLFVTEKKNTLLTKRAVQTFIWVLGWALEFFV